MANSNAYRVAAIGLDADDRTLLQSVFDMSRARTPCMEAFAFRPGKERADIVIVNGDNPRAVNGWRAYQRVHPDAAAMPIIWIGAAAPEGEHSLARPTTVIRVLALLEQIAVEQLGFTPATAVDSADSSSGGEEPEPRVADEAPAGASGGEQASILVVDDSLPARVQLETALAGIGAKVYFAETGEQAIEMLEERDYDLIFLDVVLPGIDGYETCEAIRERDESQDVPVVMLTSNSSPADKMKGELAGCDTYVIKPLRPAMLQEIVRGFVKPLRAA